MVTHTTALTLVERGYETTKLGRCRGSSRLEALSAEDGPPLRRTKRNSGLLSASRAGRLGFNLSVPVSWSLRRSSAQNRYPLALAGLATFRFVLELLIVKEKLFPSRENEIISTVNTLQHLVLKIH
jgi:hypothetical protein